VPAALPLLRLVEPELRTVPAALPLLRLVDPELRTVPLVLPLLRLVDPELRTVLPVLPVRDTLPEVLALTLELPSRFRMDPPVRVPELLLVRRLPEAGAALLPAIRDPLPPVRDMLRVLSIVPAPPVWAPLPPPMETMRGREVPPRDSGLGS